MSIPVANAHTPATLVNALAVKRNWTVEQSEFCKARAAANAAIAYPKKANSKFKYITTYAFRASSDAKGERSLLDFYGTDFQTPFPWQDGQWLSRQYSYDALPQYAFVMELQDRPKDPNRSGTVASACMTVFGIR